MLSQGYLIHAHGFHYYFWVDNSKNEISSANDHSWTSLECPRDTSNSTGTNANPSSLPCSCLLPHTSQANLFLLPNFPPPWRDPTRSPCTSRHFPHQVLETLPFYFLPMLLIFLLLPKARPCHFLPEMEISEFGSTSPIHANTSMTSLCTRSHVLTNWNKHHYTIIYWILLFSINCLQSS